MFTAQDRGLLELPFDKILVKKEDCGYCYPLLKQTRNASTFKVWGKKPFSLSSQLAKLQNVFLKSFLVD